jgi:hypothetical protein
MKPAVPYAFSFSSSSSGTDRAHQQFARQAAKEVKTRRVNVQRQRLGLELISGHWPRQFRSQIASVLKTRPVRMQRQRVADRRRHLACASTSVKVVSRTAAANKKAMSLTFIFRSVFFGLIE